MARPAGFELPTLCIKRRQSIQLSYERNDLLSVYILRKGRPIGHFRADLSRVVRGDYDDLFFWSEASLHSIDRRPAHFLVTGDAE